MATRMTNMRDLVNKASNADLLREMFGLTAERLMGLGWAPLRARPVARRAPVGGRNATAIAIGTGRRARARSSGRVRSFGNAVASLRLRTRKCSTSCRAGAQGTLLWVRHDIDTWIDTMKTDRVKMTRDDIRDRLG